MELPEALADGQGGDVRLVELQLPRLVSSSTYRCPRLLFFLLVLLPFGGSQCVRH